MRTNAKKFYSPRASSLFRSGKRNLAARESASAAPFLASPFACLSRVTSLNIPKMESLLTGWKCFNFDHCGRWHHHHDNPQEIFTSDSKQPLII